MPRHPRRIWTTAPRCRTTRTRPDSRGCGSGSVPWRLSVWPSACGWGGGAVQRKKTRQLSVLLPLAVLLLAVLTGCTSGSDRTEAPRIGTCRLSVRVDASCPEAPEDPELVSARDVVLREGDTVLDILLRGVADANPEHGEDNVR